MSDDRTLVEQLAEFAAGVETATLPADVVDSVRARVMDTLGIESGLFDEIIRDNEHIKKIVKKLAG